MKPNAADIALMWRAGKLKYKLHAHQRKLYDHFNAWRERCAAKWTEAKTSDNPDFVPLDGKYVRTYYAKCARRYGKDHFSCVLAIEECLKRPGAIVLYGTAQQKDIASIVIPLIEKIIADCPPSLKPKFRNAHNGAESGYHFANGSLLKLIGIERNPDALRGRWADLVVLSEAAYIDCLEYAVTSVLDHMFQGLPHACTLLNSTPPADPGHDVSSEFLPDCIERGAFFQATIYDNPRLSPAEIAMEVSKAGGLESPKCKLELLAEEVRLEAKVVVPEFDPDKHVREFKMPRFGLAYTVVDPGFRDLCAVTLMVYDFERAKLLVVDEWARPGAGTVEIAQAIRELEAKHVSELKYWGGTGFRPNPAARWSDTELRLIADLRAQHDLKFEAANKKDAEAALHSLRAAFTLEKIEIHPRCVKTIETFKNLCWNKDRTDFARSSRLGHGDLLDTLKYGLRMIPTVINPLPPAGVLLAAQYADPQGSLHLEDRHLRTRRSVGQVLESVLPGMRRFRKN
jgi:hypothetical protein